MTRQRALIAFREDALASRFRFCPYCREPLVERDLEGLMRAYCPACDEIFYRNSKPCAGALVVDDEGRLLLTRRGIEPYRGRWDLPGGYLEESEHPEEAAVREVLEETGLRVRLTRLVGIYLDTYGPTGATTLNIFYEARIVTGEARAADDVTELGWMRPAEIDWGTFSFDNGKQAILDWERLASSSQEA